jgi:diacylglycerol kinase (ATP)
VKSTDWRKKFRDAGRGLAFGVGTQSSVQVHLVATVVVIALAVWLRVEPTRLAVLVLTCGMVIALELVNTALEILVKAHVQEPKEFARSTLDLAAGAVLTASIAAVAVGLLIFGERILTLTGAM